MRRASIRPRSANGETSAMAALEGKQPRKKIGKLTPEQVEITRLKRKLELAEQRPTTTEVALEIMSKICELWKNLFESSRDEPPQTKQ